MIIPFNKPYLTGEELGYIQDAVSRGKISGNGYYTQKCHEFFESKYGFKKCLLTTSCTDALEMAAILCNIQEGDEVIVPSYTFVSTANAFVLRGAKIIFADSREDHPGIDESKIESLITSRTKVIIAVHYAGVACDMDIIMDIANRYKLLVVEDAAQSIDSFYKGSRLGGVGHLGCFSFHETKNIQCGEGGMLVISDERFAKRAEIIWEKGTNRAEFFRGEVNRYGWVDIGSSFLPSEVTAAFLWAQIEKIKEIQRRRLEIWNWYDENVEALFPDFNFTKPIIPDYATNNAHMYYLVLNSLSERSRFIDQLKQKGLLSVFHYLNLHKSPYYHGKHGKRRLPNSDRYENCLVRLPFYFEIKEEEIFQLIKSL